MLSVIGVSAIRCLERRANGHTRSAPLAQWNTRIDPAFSSP
jgi:hypothetical protein